VRAEQRKKALAPVRLPVGVLSVDGKTQAVLDEAVNPFCQRQSGEGDERERYVYRVLNATLVSAPAAVCIHQRPIPAETNETGFFGEFFDELRAAYARADLFEVVMTDAGVLCAAHCRKLDDLGYGYVLALKNRPDLEREARAVFATATAAPPEVESAWEIDSSRGWVKRQLWTTSAMAGWPGWEHLRQVWLVRVLARDGKNGPERVIEERLYLTNLPPTHKLRGAHILALVRAHWRIENELHGTLDIELREDDLGWVRRDNGLMNMGLLRAMAYNTLAIARSVHLRRPRLIGWQQLRDWLRDAIVFDALIEPEPEAHPDLA
jgi:hypothetical protein